jgi:hypothetical protein
MHFDQLGRLKFITLLGVAAVWPLATRAPQPIGVRGFFNNASSRYPSTPG